MRNDFTVGLLNYSAERDDCIGRPERWGSPPPLVVGTPLHDEVVGFANEIWTGVQLPVWYFLIGGPGNGKSEAVGAFVRHLNLNSSTNGGASIFDPSKGSDGGSINYWYHGSTPRGDVCLLQDASVPKNPHSDPAMDFLASLELCADPGCHLLACANRGMLLRATRIARHNPAYQGLVPILEGIDRQSQEGALASEARWVIEYNGKKIELRVWPLDHESILFGRDGNPWADSEGSVFDNIIVKATDTSNWEKNGCDQCPAVELCPMLGDARWLRDPARRKATQKILRHAEVSCGQRLVLREALGLISTVLVGCPSDFVENGSEVHPCDWVQQRLSGTPLAPKNDEALIQLVSHRIYQDLFSRSMPTGLGIDSTHQHRDKWVIDRLQSLSDGTEPIAKTLVHVDATFAKQSGPLRLVGYGSILQNFDPAIDTAWCSKVSLSVDGQIAELCLIASGHQERLEKELGLLLQRLENSAKVVAPHKDPARVFAALYRWASTLYLRLAGTALGEMPNVESLDSYLVLLNAPTRPIAGDGKTVSLRELMKSAADGDQKVKLAPSFMAELPSLQLKAVGARNRSLSPRWPGNDRLTLQVSVGSTDSIVLLTAKTFVDTWRKHILKVADWNISPAMENLMRAWRDDFVVTNGQYRNLPAVEFAGQKALIFEFTETGDVQVRQQEP